MLTKDVDDFSIHNLEWIRHKLLNYKRQIQELGFSYEMIRTPVSDKAIFGWKILDESKCLEMDLTIGKDLRLTSKWRIFKEHRTEKLQTIMDRLEGIKLLIKQGLFESGELDTLRYNIYESQLPLPPQPYVDKFLEKFDPKVGVSNHNSDWI